MFTNLFIWFGMDSRRWVDRRADKQTDIQTCRPTDKQPLI